MSYKAQKLMVEFENWLADFLFFTTLVKSIWRFVHHVKRLKKVWAISHVKKEVILYSFRLYSEGWRDAVAWRACHDAKTQKFNSIRSMFLMMGSPRFITRSIRFWFLGFRFVYESYMRIKRRTKFPLALPYHHWWQIICEVITFDFFSTNPPRKGAN